MASVGRKLQFSDKQTILVPEEVTDELIQFIREVYDGRGNKRSDHPERWQLFGNSKREFLFLCQVLLTGASSRLPRRTIGNVNLENFRKLWKRFYKEPKKQIIIFRAIFHSFFYCECAVLPGAMPTSVKSKRFSEFVKHMLKARAITAKNGSAEFFESIFQEVGTSLLQFRENTEKFLQIQKSSIANHYYKSGAGLYSTIIEMNDSFRPSVLANRRRLFYRLLTTLLKLEGLAIGPRQVALVTSLLVPIGKNILDEDTVKKGTRDLRRYLLDRDKNLSKLKNNFSSDFRYRLPSQNLWGGTSLPVSS
ncbi:MAG: hypothetical protein R3A80_03800 [Bdellovibrionota bacterium]